MSPTATITGSPETGSDARLSGVGHATSTTPPRAIKASNTTATRTRITTPTSRDDCTRFRRTCHAVFGPGRATVESRATATDVNDHGHRVKDVAHQADTDRSVRPE